MDKTFRMWEPILRDLEFFCPHIMERMIDWYPIGRNEIYIKTDDGERYSYQFIGHSLKRLGPVRKTKVTMTEEEWRKMFSRRLYRRMRSTGMLQDRLSSLTGISPVSLSKYVNGKATPSTYNLRRIADALNCSMNELGDPEWSED